MAKLSLDDRLNQIEDKISEKSFRENKGLGNEVGYYIFDYDPREELYVRNHIAYLKDRINNGNKDFRIVEFDLFHLMIEILQEEGYLEAFFDLEKENGFFEMADSLVETLGLDETNELNLIISRILQEDLTDSVVFLTGVGKCHPIIASHNILNNLHQVLDIIWNDGFTQLLQGIPSGVEEEIQCRLKICLKSRLTVTSRALLK